MGHAAKKDRTTTTTTTPEPEPVQTGTDTTPEPEPVQTGTEPAAEVRSESREGFLAAFYRMVGVKRLVVPEPEAEPESTPEPARGFKVPEYIARDREEAAARETVKEALAEALPACFAAVGRRLSAKVHRDALDVTLLLAAFLSKGWSKVLTAVVLPEVSGGYFEVQFKSGTAWTSAAKLPDYKWNGPARIVASFPRTVADCRAFGLPDSFAFFYGTFGQRHEKPGPVTVTLPADVRNRLAEALATTTTTTK